MKKIAIITSGLLPMPAIKDGAIEILLEYTLKENEVKKKYDFTVYSIYDENALKESKNYKNTLFKYIKVNKLINKASYNFFRILRKVGYSDPNFQFQFINNVIKDIKKNKYDYIIIESENHFAHKVLKNIDVPTILYLHNDKLNENIKYCNYILNNSYKIITVSDYISNRVLSIDNKFNDKVITLHNGIDIKEFLNINSSLNKPKKYKNDVIFLYVGRIEPNKGTYELVEAFNNINIKNKKLIIIGGSFHSSSKTSKYMKKIMDISDNNVIFKGYIKHNKLKEFYSYADVMIVPSMWEEPAGLVNIEAISSNMKLVVSNSGGIPEYTNNQVIIFNKNENKIDNLSNALLKAIKKDKPKLDNKYIKYFSKEEYVKRYYNVLSNIIDKE